MHSLSRLEKVLEETFKDQDDWIANIFDDALRRHTTVAGWRSAVAWASGNLQGKLPKTAKVLFDFLEKFERCDDCGAVFATTCNHSASCKNVR